MFVKQFTLEKQGDEWLGDRHTFDHQSLLATGSVEAWVDGKAHNTYHAPTIIVIAKEISHNFLALEDDTTLFCIHPLRKKDGTDDIFEPEDKPLLSDAMELSLGR